MPKRNPSQVHTYLGEYNQAISQIHLTKENDVKSFTSCTSDKTGSWQLGI